MPPDDHDPRPGEDWEHLIHSSEIPGDFQSEYLSGPFVRCVDCDEELLETGAVYSVIRSFVIKEPIFEMAICARCSTSLASSYSAESKAAFESAMRTWRSTEPASDDSSAAPPDDGGSLSATLIVPGDMDQLDRCAACERPREACRRYSIVGTFLGRALVSPTWTPFRLPLLICDDCNGQMAENISRQTRDAWDRFVEDHFDGPPGIELDSPRLDPILL